MKVIGSEAFFVESRLGFAIFSSLTCELPMSTGKLNCCSGVRRSAEVGRAANLKGEVR
jgi:hypothetical protein